MTNVECHGTRIAVGDWTMPKSQESVSQSDFNILCPSTKSEYARGSDWRVGALGAQLVSMSLCKSQTGVVIVESVGKFGTSSRFPPEVVATVDV